MQSPSTQATMPSARALRLCDLPDDLLAACLAPLDVKRRLSSVCLVSKRFHAACHRPELLRHLAVAIRDYSLPLQKLPVVASLASWLQHHGRHLQTLELDFSMYPRSISEFESLRSSVFGCLKACSQLRRLRVEEGPTLEGRPALSTTLTALSLPDYSYLPEGDLLLKLPNLRRLSTGPIPIAYAGQLAQLAGLTGLTRLVLSHSAVPASLHQLTALRMLELISFDMGYSEEEQQHLTAALGSLRQLTHLGIRSWEGPASLPSELAGLASLRIFTFYSSPLADPNEPAPEALPHGPWLASLRCIKTHWHLLTASVDVLRAAPRLSEVVAVGLPDPEATPNWRGFWDWAAQHPPLRRLTLEEEEYGEQWEGRDEAVNEFADEVIRLWQARPRLKFSRGMHFGWAAVSDS